MANAPEIFLGKLSQYALQILDFTLNMPHEILGPVAPPPYNIRSTPPGDKALLTQSRKYLSKSRMQNITNFCIV